MAFPTLSQDENLSRLALVAVEVRYTRDDLDLLKRTVGAGLDDNEFALLVKVSQRRGLDLFARQLYGVKRSGKMTLQTGIDGYRLMAGRSHAYAGSDDATFEGDGDPQPKKATITVYRMVEGVRVPFTASARWSEYYQSVGGMWDKMPYTMLAKCAEALALRKAFPEEVSGIYTDSEMMQADHAPTAKSAPQTRSQPRQTRVVEEKPAAPTKPRKWASLQARAHGAGMYETQNEWKDLILRICGLSFTAEQATNADYDAVEQAIADKEAENAALESIDLHDIGTDGGQ